MSEPTKKPREFWITRNGLNDNDRISNSFTEPVFKHDVVTHVREVSPAFDAMVVAMAEALEFYSNPKSWGEDIRYSVLIQDDDTEEINGKGCGGKRGREALALYREWENKIRAPYIIP